MRRVFEQLPSDDRAQAGTALDLLGQITNCVRIYNAAESAIDYKALLFGIRQFFQDRDEIFGRVAEGQPVSDLLFPGGRRGIDILRGATGRADSLTHVPPAP